MTVSYTAEVATCKSFGCFLKLLFRWRGSIYKLVWRDLLVFLGIYFSLSLLYRFCLTSDQQNTFEQICRYCDKYGSLIPVSFVLGFYVSIVVERWWDQYRAIPWPDSIAVYVSSTIQGQDEKARMMKRSIMRYVCLALTMAFTLISPRVKKRFPTNAHFVEAGLLLENEKEIIEEINRNVPSYSKHWLPIVWAASIVTRARKEGKIRDDFAVKTLLDELNRFRGGCGLLTSYDWISVPLVYTQVVTLAVYSYFFSCIMARQWLKPDPQKDLGEDGGTGKVEKDELDLIFPIFTTLQFFFYMGWLKVAETLLNPFGDDDDNFEVNWIVDRDIQVSYLIVDEMHVTQPELLRDQYWNEVYPPELPHTVASEIYHEEPPHHSTAKIELSKKEEKIVPSPSMQNLSREDMEGGKKGRGIHSGGSIRSNRTSQSNLSQSSGGGIIIGSMSRAGSVTSLLRRAFSRGKLAGEQTAESGGGVGVGLVEPGLGDSLIGGSTITMNRNILEETIEEVDENQATIKSMRKEEAKPTAMEIFGGGDDGGSGGGGGEGGGSAEGDGEGKVEFYLGSNNPPEGSPPNEN